MTYYSKQSLRQKSEIFATSLYTKEALVSEISASIRILLTKGFSLRRGSAVGGGEVL